MKKYGNRKYSYIYIDGNHSYQGVLFDYKVFWPRLLPGGLIGFHDIDVKTKKPEGKYGVGKLWKKIGKDKGIAFYGSWSGLGFLQKEAR